MATTKKKEISQNETTEESNTTTAAHNYPAEQNGVKFPNANPQLAVWNNANAACADKGAPLTLKEFIDAVGLDDMGAAALVSEYGRWKKYFGISGRLTPVKEKVEVQKTEKIKIEREIQNNVVRPLAGTKCGGIWALADSLSTLPNSPVTSKDLLQACAEKGYNLGNASSEYSRWRKFNGISGRAVSEKVETLEELNAKIKLHEERAAKSLTIANELRAKAAKLPPALRDGGTEQLTEE